MLQLHVSASRGHADHGWLQSSHSFSFANYHDPSRMGFSALRVINEDWVAPHTGFGEHGHRDMEIVTYMLSGAIEHRDSTGTHGILRAGDVQQMSAGRGIRHSEMNPSDDTTHLLQCWIEPAVTSVQPSYAQRHFGQEEKRGRLCCIAGQEEGALPLRQDAAIYASLLTGSEEITIRKPQRWLYLQMVTGSLQANDKTLQAGDGLHVWNEDKLHLHQGQGAEFLLFELPPGKA